MEGGSGVSVTIAVISAADAMLKDDITANKVCRLESYHCLPFCSCELFGSLQDHGPDPLQDVHFPLALSPASASTMGLIV